MAVDRNKEFHKNNGEVIVHQVPSLEKVWDVYNEGSYKIVETKKISDRKYLRKVTKYNARTGYKIVNRTTLFVVTL